LAKESKVFDAELLGFTATQYWQFASILLTPTLGFVFLFLLNRPLKKLPFIDTGDDYQPPRWVLPVFAISSLFLASLSVSISAFLLFMNSHSSDETFLKSHQLERTLEIPADHGPLRLASLIVENYDGYSNFDVFVNGYMAVSSETSCAMLYQCNNDAFTMSSSEAKVATRYGSMHNLAKINNLPLQISLAKYIMPGENHIDIVSVNSGIGDCRVTFSISLEFSSSKVTRDVFILPLPDNSIKKMDGDVFDSYGSLPTKLIEPYFTRAADVSYMLCQRIRYTFTLS
jgi:hypothetical protein